MIMDRRVYVAARVRPMLEREMREGGEDHRPCVLVDQQVSEKSKLDLPIT